MSIAKEQMKTIETSRKLWQSAGESSEKLESLSERRGQEFPVLPQNIRSEIANPSRRRFLQWFGAATALMTTQACKRRPEDTLVPYVRKPQGYVYGVPVWYASTSANGYGILVKTREGRPIKLEGNPDHPVNEGGLDTETQASILDLYNPERLKGPMNVKSGKLLPWAEFNGIFSEALTSAAPGSVRVLTGGITSPSLQGVLKKFIDQKKARHHIYEDIPSDPIAEAHSILYGRKVVPTYHFDKADVVVSVDADFLGTWIRPLEFTKKFSKRRRIHRGDSHVNRLFVFESMMTTTGIAADHRAAIRPSHQLSILLGLLNEISKSVSLDTGLKTAIQNFSLSNVAKAIEIPEGLLAEAARSLVESPRKSIVVAGGRGPQALEVQLAAAALNAALQNISSTIDLERSMITGLETGDSVSDLVKDAIDGKVDVLVIRGVNPLYSYPAAEFKQALLKIKLIVTIGSELNETAQASHFVLGESHFLEAWSDSEIRRGVVSIQQPTIEPFYDTRSFSEILQSWITGDVGDQRALLQAYWRQNYYRGSLNFQDWWNEQLRKGVTITGSSLGSVGSLAWSKAAAALKVELPRLSKETELVLYSSMNLKSGACANNAWLQELPDPVSKVTWGNFVAVSPLLARELGLRKPEGSNFNSNVLSVEFEGRKIRLPAFIQPGMPANVVAIALGYGRSSAGTLGTDVGVNAFPFIANHDQLRGQKVQVSKTGETYELACTQKHFELHGRDEDILQQMTLAEFLNDPKTAKKKEAESFSMYAENEFVYPGHRWGMAIDLNSCTGCNACVVACYSENNISVVGADEVRMGRHMAWLRMDLYYSGEEESPEAAFEPMLCQQCSKAPCETVCPVLATVHSSDGLNDMTYNRCVGTRYCANNCPYKVRRFNYFQYSDAFAQKMEMEDPLPMLMNPDVTVRTRGVMEKCTFCVQRIRKTVDEYRDKRAALPDGAIQTACQQSCPADCIVFGDLNDTNSEVSRLSAQAQGFKVLEILNAKPAITYLPRIRNKGTA